MSDRTERITPDEYRAMTGKKGPEKKGGVGTNMEKTRQRLRSPDTLVEVRFPFDGGCLVYTCREGYRTGRNGRPLAHDTVSQRIEYDQP